MMERELEQKKEETLGETLKTVFWAIVIAGMVRTFWVEPYKIPSGSMYPTLEVGDFLFISKYTYGYSKHSFPFSFPKFEGRIWDDKPQRGDVVVFKYPGDNKTDFIKRVIIGVAVFFVPLLVDVVMWLADLVWQGDYIHCDF